MSENFFRVNKGIKLNPSAAPVSPAQGEIYNDVADNKIKAIGPIQSVDSSGLNFVQVDPIASIIKSDGSVVQYDGTFNSVKNSTFENGTLQGWETVQFAIDSGTGMATSVLSSGGTNFLSIESVNPIRGNYSLKFSNINAFTPSQGYNGLGFWSDPFTLDPISFGASYTRYIGASGKYISAFTSLVRFAIYDVTNDIIYNLPDFPAVNFNTAYADVFVSNYFNNLGISSDIRFVFYTGEPTSGSIQSFELLIDDLFFGPLHPNAIGKVVETKIGNEGGTIGAGNLILTGPGYPSYNMGPLMTNGLSSYFANLLINTATFDSSPGVPTYDITMKTGDWIGTAIPSYPQGGTGELTLASGDLTATGMAPGNTTGNVILKSGISTYNDSGEMLIFSGDAGNNSGLVSIYSGNSTAGDSGSVSLYSGNSDGPLTGQVLVKSGNITTGSGNSGILNLNTGNVDSGNSGLVFITSGGSVSGNSGDIIIETGSSLASRGSINLDASAINLFSQSGVQDEFTFNKVVVGRQTIGTSRKIELQGGPLGTSVSLKASDTASAAYDIVFPTAAPAATQVMQYNGTTFVWTNGSVTVNGTSIALGSSGTITANTTNLLTVGTGLQLDSGTTFDGSAAKTISIDSTVATLTGTQSLTNKTIGDSITFAQITTPSSPAAGFNKFYVKADGYFYSLNSSGSETIIGGGGWTVSNSTSLTASGTVTISLAGSLQAFRVAGSTAGITTLSTTPFGSVAPVDGICIRLIGTNDSNPVKITNNDIAKGCLLNGDCTLYKGNVIELQYIATDDRYYEVSRNF